MSGQPLSNEDFRRMMMTPKPGSQPPAAKDADKAGKKQKSGKPFRPKPKPVTAPDEEEDQEEGPSYRDRAAERRKGVGEFQAMAAAFGGPDGSGLDHLTEEETKFLGGDVEHTHLVKGLDYALLNKVRSDQQQAPAAPTIQPTAAVKQTVEDTTKPTFKTVEARGVYDVLFGPKQRQLVNEQFLPKRTAFVYNLDRSDNPTTVKRAKEDCPVPRKTVMGALEPAVMDSLLKVMAYMAIPNGKKRVKKRTKAAAIAVAEEEPIVEPSVPKPVDEDEDIFADAGTDYVVERRQGGAATGEKPSYFAGPSAIEGADLPPLPSNIGPSRPSEGAVDAYPEVEEEDAAAEAARKAAEAKEKAKKAKRMLEEAANDGYDECYPAYYDYAGAVADSDDEEGKPKSLVPAETDPAAAARKEAMKLQQKEKSKFTNELQQIEKIFDDKGYDKTGFNKRAAKADKPADAVPQKKRRI